MRGNIMVQYKRTLLGSVLLAGSMLAQAEGFELSEKLTITGFIDMSTSYIKPETGPSSSTSGVDQFEIDFLYAFSDKMTAQVDLEYHDDGGGELVDIEQAFVNYDLGSGFSVKGGRFLSYSGWETEEPTGLFQYSGAGYAKYFYGGYQQGVSAMYSHSIVDVALSVVNDLGDLTGQVRDSRHAALEAMVAVRPLESWVIKAFYLTDELEDPLLPPDETISLINFWTSYSIAGVTLALEANKAKNSPVAAAAYGLDTDATGGLAMVNYAYEAFGITLRAHQWEVEDATGTVVEDMSGITLAPSYKVNDNLLLILEFRTDDDKLAKAKTDSTVLEALVMF
jgi:hypothetical protein